MVYKKWLQAFILSRTMFIRPRNKNRGVPLKNPIVLKMHMVESLLHLNISEAACKLGISVTTLKWYLFVCWNWHIEKIMWTDSDMFPL